MRLKLLLVSLVAIASLTSCSSGSDAESEASSNLTMDIGSSPALLIPAPTYSCEEVAKGSLVGTGAISKSYFRLPSPNITWSGTDALSEIRLVLLNFKVDTAQMKYECTLSGATLGILFYKTSTDSNGTVTVTTWDQKLGFDAAVNVTTTRDLTSTTNNFKKCEIICGGVTLPTGTGRFTAKGRWELFGVQRKYKDATKNDFEEFPLKINGDFSVSNPLD